MGPDFSVSGQQPNQIGLSGQDASKRPSVTGRGSQGNISEFSRESSTEGANKKPALPKWAQSGLTGLGKVFLGAGIAVCGAVALAVLPLSIVGIGIAFSGHDRMERAKDKADQLGDKVSAYDQLNKEEKLEQEKIEGDYKIGKRMHLAGQIIAAPVTGLLYCLQKI